MHLSKTGSIRKSKQQSFNALVSFPPGCHSLDPPFQVQHLALLIEWQPFCIPGSWVDLSAGQLGFAQELSSFRTSFLSLGLLVFLLAFLGLEEVSLSFPEEQRKKRLGVWVRAVREGSNSLLCAGAILSQQLLVMDPWTAEIHRTCTSPYQHLLQASLADPYSTVLANPGKSCKNYLIFPELKC